MIKYNNSNINDWDYGSDNIVKVYRNNAVCYYKITSSGGTSGQTPCFAVVEDISQYSDTEFEDVFNKADEKWYKLNNLNQYEEYGVYGSGRTITYYEGKLTIDSESSSRLPSGYTEVEYVENQNQAYINTGLELCSATTNTFQVEAKVSGHSVSSQLQNIFSCMSEAGEPYQGFTSRYNNSSGRVENTFKPSGDGSFSITTQDGISGITTTSLNGLSYSHDYPLTVCAGLDGSKTPFRFSRIRLYTFKVILNNNLVMNLVPCTRDSDSKAGVYDIVNNQFYSSASNYELVAGSAVTPTYTTYEYQYSGSSWVNVGEVSGSTRVPIGYTEIEYLETPTVSEYPYIDTTFAPNQNTRVIADLQYVQTNTNPRAFGCGAWNGVGYIFNAENGISSNGTWRWKYGSNNNNNWIATNITTDFNRHKIEINNGNLYMDDTLVSTTTVTTFQLTDNIGLFGFINGGALGGTSTGEYMTGKFYSFKIYDNGTLVRDFVPCKRDNDSEYGMYDVVNNSFYVSPNNYSFTGGSATTQVVYPLYYTEIQDPPNNLTFSSMTEAEEYECPYVGLNANIDGTYYIFDENYDWVTKYGLFEVSGEYMCDSGNKYQKMEEKVRNVDDTWSSQDPQVYEKGELIESASTDCSHILPNVPFMLNYNAKNYNASTYSIGKTEGQLRDVDAVCNYGYNIVDHSSDGYISVTGNTRMLLSGTTYMGRNNTQTGCTMTIVSKVRTTSGYSILTNRGGTSSSQMNWMWRYPTNGIFLHGSSSYNNPKYNTDTSASPIIASIKTYYNSGVQQQLKDWTNNGSYSGAFAYGTEYNGDSALFCDYVLYNNEFWKGDFYWVYMSQSVLTDEQIQQVIDYNENL